MEEIKGILDKLLVNNDEYIVEHIVSYLGNQCDRCFNYQDKNLTIVISFNDGIRDYNFRDHIHTRYGLKKFCDSCIYSKASSCKIYVEIPQTNINWSKLLKEYKLKNKM